MQTAMRSTRKTQWIAGAVAVIATVLTMGGPLVLAEHYSQTGSSQEESGYHTSQQNGHIAGSDNDKFGAAALPQSGAQQS